MIQHIGVSANTTINSASIFPTTYSAGSGDGIFHYTLVDPGWEDPEDGGAGNRVPRRPRLPTAPASVALLEP